MKIKAFVVLSSLTWICLFKGASVNDTPLSKQLNPSEPEWFSEELSKLKETELRLMCWKERIVLDKREMEFTRFPQIPCDTDPYWKIVSQREESLQLLINRLNDQSPTKIYHECKDGNLNIGEVCYLMLQQTIVVPLAAITNRQYCLWDSCSVYDYFPKNLPYIEEFQEQLTQYYGSHTYYFEEYPEKDVCLAAKGITGKLRVNY